MFAPSWLENCFSSCLSFWSEPKKGRQKRPLNSARSKFCVMFRLTSLSPVKRQSTWFALPNGDCRVILSPFEQLQDGSPSWKAEELPLPSKCMLIITARGTLIWSDFHRTTFRRRLGERNLNNSPDEYGSCVTWADVNLGLTFKSCWAGNLLISPCVREFHCIKLSQVAYNSKQATAICVCAIQQHDTRLTVWPEIFISSYHCGAFKSFTSWWRN